MKFFESFRKGVEKAKEDVSGNKEAKSPFEMVQEKITDKEVSDGDAAVALKEFMNSGLDAKEISAAIDLFIQERPQAVERLTNK